MDKIKKAFFKVRTDINFIYSEMRNLKQEVEEIKKVVISLIKIPEKDKEHPQINPTQNHKNKAFPTYNPTHNYPLRPLKHQNLPVSTGNQGVPTDRQTDKQTNRQHKVFKLKSEIDIKSQSSIDDAVKILDSLDNIKKEIRLKFKRLTNQELLVFSTLYQLEEKNGYTEYKTISQKLNLSESSIRDYIGRLIKKGIPINKKRINNKIIHLSVSENLKKIASLNTILRLRDI